MLNLIVVAGGERKELDIEKPVPQERFNEWAITSNKRGQRQEVTLNDGTVQHRVSKQLDLGN